jgi:hypothetical protein
VFCSDGLDPIENNIKQHPYSRYSYGVASSIAAQNNDNVNHDNNNNNNNAHGEDEEFAVLLDEDSSSITVTHVSPMTAFEVFQGKVMPSRSLYRQGGAPAASAQQQVETPLEKLARLQREVEELQVDIATMDSHTNPQADNDDAEDSEAATVSSSSAAQLSRMAQELASKLASVETSQNQPHASSASLQSHLTQLVHEELAKLKQGSSKISTEGENSEDNTNDKQQAIKGGGEIKYQLFSSPAGGAGDGSDAANLEARLGALEKVLGTSSHNSNSTLLGDNNKTPLSDRLTDMERILQQLDGAGASASASAGSENKSKSATTGTPSALTEASNRAKVIR